MVKVEARGGVEVEAAARSPAALSSHSTVSSDTGRQPTAVNSMDAAAAAAAPAAAAAATASDVNREMAAMEVEIAAMEAGA